MKNHYCGSLPVGKGSNNVDAIRGTVLQDRVVTNQHLGIRVSINRLNRSCVCGILKRNGAETIIVQG